MSNEYLGNAVPAPGITDGPTLTDTEILYSTQGYTQKGVTIKPGVGVLPAGCVLGQVTATKLWTVYDDNASDGTEVARGFLRQAVDAGTSATGARVTGNIVVRGIVKYSQLSGLDANAVTDLNGRSDTVLDAFFF